MYDNYYTKYEDAQDFINERTAKRIIDKLEVDICLKQMTAEKYAYLSKAYVYSGDLKKAINAAKMSIKLDKDYAYGYTRLAFAYGRLGKRQEALENLRIAEKKAREDDWFLWAFWVGIFAWLELKGSANYYLKKLTELKLDTPEYNYAMGFATGSPEQIGEYEKALAYFNKALDYKNEYDLYYKMMIAYGYIDDWDNTLLYLNKCLAFGETEDLLDRKIRVYIWCDRCAEIIDDIKRYYRMTKDDKQDALLYLASAHDINENNPKKALKYLYFAEKTTTPTEYLYKKIAELYEKLENYEKALLYHKKRLVFDNNDENALLSISYCYSRLKEHELAELYADKVILLNPDYAYPYYRKGNILCDLQDYEKACEAYKNAVEKDPTDVDYYACVSFAYSKLEKHELSLEYANRGILVNNDDYYIHFRKGWAFQELGKYEDAIKSFEKCIELNDTYVDAYADISYCYSKMNELKKAMLYANKAIMINKDYAYAHYRKAWSLHRLGNFEEAKTFYSSAVKLDPTDSYSYIGLSAVNLDINNSAEALKAASMAIFLNRDCAEAYYFKGSALSLLGKAKEAEKYYIKAKKLGYT